MSDDILREIQLEQDAHSARNQLATALLAMNASDRDAFVAALKDDGVQSTVIHKVLNNNGYDVSYDAVRRFRNRSVTIPAEIDY